MDRRPSWLLRGRRLLLALAAMLAAAAGAAAAAQADQAVVNATIYPGPSGSVSARQATLSQLQACPLYAGPNPIYLYPGQQPYQAPGDSTWTVDEVLQCGLGIPAGQVSAVQVQTANARYETPLTSAALTDPGQYHDPSAPGALPIVSSDGAGNQNTYVRPYRGGSDDNAGDEVVQPGAPITLLVYLNGAVLTVDATQQTVSHTSKTKVVKLAATARDASGAPVPPSALTWSWSFGDGHGSTASMPTHTFAAGVYSVSVQVTDTAAGSGGTATLRVAFTASGAPGNRTQSGGQRPTKSKSPTGSDHGTHKSGAGTHSNRTHGASSGTQRPSASTSPDTTTSTTTTTTTTTTTPTTTATTTAATTTTTTTAAATTTTTSTAAPAARPRTPHRRSASPPRPPKGTEVSGQLISDVAPLPAASSPLVHVTPAAATPEATVRQASHLPAAPAVGGALAVGVLLALGAGRELRGRHRWPDAGT